MAPTHSAVPKMLRDDWRHRPGAHNLAAILAISLLLPGLGHWYADRPYGNILCVISLASLFLGLAFYPFLIALILLHIGCLIHLVMQRGEITND